MRVAKTGTKCVGMEITREVGIKAITAPPAGVHFNFVKANKQFYQ